ncbi:ring finger protein-like [Lissotriton helveticus]
MLEQAGEEVDLCGSAGKGADMDPPSWEITAGVPDFPDTSPRKAPAKWCRTTPFGAGLRDATTHPFSSGDGRHFVVECNDEQDEAAELLLGEVPSTENHASEPGDGHLPLEEMHKVGVEMINWSDDTDICISDGKSSSKATLDLTQTSVDLCPLDQTQPPVELCPLLDLRSSDASSQVVDESTLSSVTCPHQRSGEPSGNLCLSPEQGAMYGSLCQSMEKSSPSCVLPVSSECHGLEERASSRIMCSPMGQRVPPAVMCPPMGEKASSPALGLSSNLGTNATLLHAYAESEPFSVACLTPRQGTLPTVLDAPLEARVPIGDQCPYPEENRVPGGHSYPLHHKEACPTTNTFVAECMEVSSDQQMAEASILSVEDEDAEHQEECPICTEQYDTGRCRQALLNCQHVVCDSCVKAIMDQSGQADIGRVKCPICRQKTPMMKWEILKLQETMLEQDCTRLQTVRASLTVAQRRPGLWGALEYNFQQRFHTSRTFSCIPCLRYPLCFIERLNELERRSRCCYLFTLVLLYFVEKLCFVLPFLPILMLVLIITLDTHT